MIQLNYQNVSTKHIGQANGLDLDSLFSTHKQALQSIVENLYAKKNQPGAWCRWLTLGYNEQLERDIETYAGQVKGLFNDMVILGIGGSSLGGYALLKGLLHPYWNNLSAEQRKGYPRYHFVENVDADQVNGLFDILTPEKTLFIVISKSGTTAETMSAFMIAKSWLEKSLKKNEVSQHIVAITDAKTGLLRPLAQTENYQTFEVPDDVGGRFSVFSAVGLLPAALCGISIASIQQGIQDMDALTCQLDLDKNPAAQAALIQVQFYQQGKPIAVFMPYSFSLAPVSSWMVQLWAESLGKRLDLDGQEVFVGPTPVQAVGVTDQHSQVQLYNEGPFDKVFTFITVDQPNVDVTIPDNQFQNVEDLGYLSGQPLSKLMTAEFESTRASLTRNQRPNITLSMPQVDAYHLAQLLYLLQVQTAIAGALLNIDPFNQPGVELAKQYTYALMGRTGYEHLVAEAKGELKVTI
jgi:glucose-6-phosphate isomerase